MMRLFGGLARFGRAQVRGSAFAGLSAAWRTLGSGCHNRLRRRTRVVWTDGNGASMDVACVAP